MEREGEMRYLHNTSFSQVVSLEKRYREVMEMRQDRKSQAIETIWFVTKLIEMIYPGKIEARWFGSYEEPGVYGYPKVKVNAFHINSKKVLSSWEIDASGEVDPPFISADDVISDIMIGLRRLKIFENF